MFEGLKESDRQGESSQKQGDSMLVRYDAACQALAECVAVDEVKDIHDKAKAIEAYAKQAKNPKLEADAQRIIWRARDRLGELLAEMPQEHRGRNSALSSGADNLRKGIEKNLAQAALDVRKVSEADKARALSSSDPDKEMRGLVSQARRQARHQEIASKAKAVEGDFGPFALVYCDPPWKFATYSEKGLEKAPDRHYPTMTDEEIAGLTIAGKGMAEIAAKDAACLMWCTSSNIHRALGVLEAWGFEYKSQAVWVKTTSEGKVWQGAGLVFRNAHEVLLYATRGNMPGPQYQPPSVFMLPRGAHSAKPPEVRSAIERMYPDFDALNRVELFCRDKIEAWSTWGLEA